jgi:hypothetical protein
METKNPLIGKTLKEVVVAKDRTAIKFVLDGGEEVVAYCDADCCSYTWIEHVELPTLPAVVLAVADIDMPAASPPGGKNGPESTEEVAFYGLRVTTSTGHLVIDYRNDSNGYYGGSLTWPGNDYHYGGVYGQNKKTDEWPSPGGAAGGEGGERR